jgi:hypothetical protein
VGAVFCLVELRGFEPLTSCMPSRDQAFRRYLSLPSALVMRQIRADRGGPLVTVVVPCHILQASSKATAATQSAQAQACAGSVRQSPPHLWSASAVAVVTPSAGHLIQALHVVNSL